MRKRIEGTNGSNKEMSNDILRVVRGCSSDGRAFASHARGKGIDTPHLHIVFFSKEKHIKRSRRKREARKIKVGVCKHSCPSGLRGPI